MYCILPAQVMDLEAELKSARERAKSSEARPSPPKQTNCASVLAAHTLLTRHWGGRGPLQRCGRGTLRAAQHLIPTFKNRNHAVPIGAATKTDDDEHGATAATYTEHHDKNSEFPLPACCLAHRLQSRWRCRALRR